MTKQEAPTTAVKKIDWAEQFINQHLQAFRCPYCHEAMVSAENHSVVCEKGHRFNISKKALLHFKQNANTDYDATLFQHRYELAQRGFFEPLLEALLPYLSGNEEKFIVDIGCGRQPFIVVIEVCTGTFMWNGYRQRRHSSSVGSFWKPSAILLRDLANLPAADESCGTL